MFLLQTSNIQSFYRQTQNMFPKDLNKFGLYMSKIIHSCAEVSFKFDNMLGNIVFKKVIFILFLQTYISKNN